MFLIPLYDTRNIRSVEPRFFSEEFLANSLFMAQPFDTFRNRIN